MLKLILFTWIAASLFIIGCGNNGETNSASELSSKLVVEKESEISPTEIPRTNGNLVENLERIQITEGSVARYKIGESLTWYPDPIVAIGESTQVSGNIVINEIEQSIEGSILVDVSVLKSDKNKRDNWVRRSGGIGTEVTLHITSFEGLFLPLAKIGQIEFVLYGDLEVSGKFINTKWDVSGTLSDTQIQGKAKTALTWEQLGLSKPALPFIISVEDEINLELEFKATRN